RARATWTLGSYPGRQTLLASVENVDSALSIVAEAEPVAENTRISPIAGSLSGRAGEAVPETVGIRVTDSAGRVLPDVPIRWTALDGGSIEPLVPRTDSLGLAQVRWVLSKKTGAQRLRVQVGNGPASRALVPVTLTAKALAGPPAGVLVESGADQRATAGAELAKPVVVRVVDANGSSVADAELELSASAGILSDTLIRTDSLGRARISWTMGRSAGPHTLGVHVEGVKKVVKIVVTAKAAAPANLSFDDAIRQSKAPRSAARTKRLFAVVTDLYGNPVPDAKVSFKATSGTVNPRRAMSDARGRAELTWKMGAKPGEQVLSGTVAATDVKGDYTAEVPSVPPVRKTVALKPKTGS
ncbi:MAG TPA: Ig-like domain-containing protein, partial [Gemmatimonadaceae bacterium]|nr:Ig-like domain-containing protein [Gemmatimonadaceae bacterium]